jgi:hypothetical protein
MASAHDRSRSNSQSWLLPNPDEISAGACGIAQPLIVVDLLCLVREGDRKDILTRSEFPTRD